MIKLTNSIRILQNIPKSLPLFAHFGQTYAFSTSPQSPDKKPSQKSFYNWQDPSSYIKCLQQKYYLNDIIDGYYHLRDRKNQQQSQYTDKQIQFILYVAVLFPELEEEILKNVAKTVENQDRDVRTQGFVKYVNILCDRDKASFNRNKLSKSKKIKQIPRSQYLPILQQYLNKKPQCFTTLQQIATYLSSLSMPLPLTQASQYQVSASTTVAFQKDLDWIFQQFKKISYKLMNQKQFALSRQEINLIGNIVYRFGKLDKNVGEREFLAGIPAEYKTDLRVLANLLVLLPDLLPGYILEIITFYSKENNKNPGAIVKLDIQIFHQMLTQLFAKLASSSSSSSFSSSSNSQTKTPDQQIKRLLYKDTANIFYGETLAFYKEYDMENTGDLKLLLIFILFIYFLSIIAYINIIHCVYYHHSCFP